MLDPVQTLEYETGLLAKCTFASLARMVFMQRQRMKDLPLRVRVVVRTSNMKISRRRFEGDRSKHCTKKRAAIAARLSFPH